MLSHLNKPQFLFITSDRYCLLCGVRIPDDKLEVFCGAEGRVDGVRGGDVLLEGGQDPFVFGSLSGKTIKTARVKK